MVAVIAPILIGGAVLATIWSSLPDRVAIHWGAAGEADGFVDRGLGLLALTFGIPAIVGVVLVAVVAAVPATAPGIRFLVAVPAATTWFFIGRVVVSLVGQTDGESDLRWWWFGAALVAAACGAAAAMIAAGPAPEPAPAVAEPPATAARLADRTGSALAWTGETSSGRGLWVVLGVAIVPAIVFLALGVWPVVLVMAPVVLVILGTTRFRVTIGAEQVVAAGAMGGWPRLRVPLSTITRADATTTTVYEWGGWGIRARHDGSAVVTRAGPALELRRADDTRVVITVDDAVTAAATVNTLLARRHQVAGAVGDTRRDDDAAPPR